MLLLPTLEGCGDNEIETDEHVNKRDNLIYKASRWDESQQGVGIFNRMLLAFKVIALPNSSSLQAEETQERNYPRALQCTVSGSICQQVGELR